MRHVFFSFDWDDVWRVNQVRNSWVTKGSYTAAGCVDSVKHAKYGLTRLAGINSKGLFQSTALMENDSQQEQNRKTLQF